MIGYVTRRIPLPAEPSCWSWPVPAMVGTPDADMLRLVAFHSGRCGVCGRTLARLVVDHDHWSNLVRGFLCHSCNPSEVGSRTVFDAYRRRHPAAILKCRIVYSPTNRHRLQGYRTGRLIEEVAVVLRAMIAEQGPALATRNPERLMAAVNDLGAPGERTPFALCRAAFRIADLIESSRPESAGAGNGQVLQIAEYLVEVGTNCGVFNTAMLRTRKR